ncbi:MAG: hypothetical protein ACRC0A_02055 [Chitinophagaceae bacterium]
MKKQSILLFASIIFLVSCGSSSSINSADALFNTTETSLVPPIQSDTNNVPKTQDVIKQPVVANNRKKIAPKNTKKKPVKKTPSPLKTTKKSVTTKTSSATKQSVVQKLIVQKPSIKTVKQSTTVKQSMPLKKTSKPNKKK